MEMEMLFYQNNQQKELYKTGFVIKFADIFAFFIDYPQKSSITR